MKTAGDTLCAPMITRFKKPRAQVSAVSFSNVPHERRTEPRILSAVAPAVRGISFSASVNLMSDNHTAISSLASSFRTFSTRSKTFHANPINTPPAAN